MGQTQNHDFEKQKIKKKTDFTTANHTKSMAGCHGRRDHILQNNQMVDSDEWQNRHAIPLWHYHNGHFITLTDNNGLDISLCSRLENWEFCGKKIQSIKQ